MLTRRTFIKSGAASAGAAALGAGAAAQEPGRGTAGIEGYNYRLPAFKKGSRLLFQGDSITDMKWGRNQKDRNHYLGHSYVYLIAARLGVDMAEAQLDVYNRGMSGHKVSDLRARWQKDALDMRPDLLSVLIGINDVNRIRNRDAIKTWEDDYRSILTSSRKANPDLRIVLLDPFVLQCGGSLSREENYKRYRAQVERQLPIVKQLAEDFDAVHVRTQEVFDAAAKAVAPGQWIWDGIHPLPQGHELIARAWLREVSARWN
jgi:lysophospholipase L1-like esterase